jgi:ABC-type transport system substrate-binding protein
MFTWLGTPTSPITDENVHACSGSLNNMNYCNRTVSRLLAQVKSITNDAKRAKLLNRADALIAADIPHIPLFARPAFLIHEKRYQGLVRDPTQQTDLWNVATWRVTAR